MDINNLTRKISALRAMTAPDSITPEVLGSLLQQIADLIGALNQIDTSEATDLITRVSAAEANAETARQAAQNALTASEANVIDSFSFDQTSTVLQLSLKQHGHDAVLLNLPGATTTFAGILTATDKYHLDVAYNKYLKQLTTSSYADRVTLNYKRHDDTVTQVTFVGASTYEAGLMTAVAGLDANGLVKSELLQRNMLFNIDADADLSGLTPGDIFFSDGSLFMYEYTNNHGSRISSPVGDPQTDIIYCHKSTGLLYKWDSSGGVFIRFGINLDGNGRMSSSQATPQVMKSMGSTLDNAGNTGNTQVYVTLNVGDTYFDPSEGKIFYKKSSSVEIDLGAPSKLLIYANAQSNKLYRWSGSAMVELG